MNVECEPGSSRSDTQWRRVARGAPMRQVARRPSGFAGKPHREGTIVHIEGPSGQKSGRPRSSSPPVKSSERLRQICVATHARHERCSVGASVSRRDAPVSARQ